MAVTDAGGRYQTMDGESRVVQNLVYNTIDGDWELQEQWGTDAVTTNIYAAVDDIEQYILDTLEHYKFYGWELDTSVFYMGYQTKGGAWYVKKYDPSTGGMTYAAGSSSPPSIANLSAQSFAAFETTF